MPNLSRCKQKDEKLYCWDNQEKRFVEVKLTPLDTHDVPAEVIEEMLEELIGSCGGE